MYIILKTIWVSYPIFFSVCGKIIQHHARHYYAGMQELLDIMSNLFHDKLCRG
jgi:hypothetical protein